MDLLNAPVDSTVDFQAVKEVTRSDSAAKPVEKVEMGSG